MFKQATLQLTGWYLAIIMLISLAFSVVLYQVSTREVGNGLRTPPSVITQQFPNISQGIQNFEELRNERIEESRNHIVNDLFMFNFIIFIAGGAASYLLARKTLEPIETAHESQSRFTADASHELRTPLSAMRTEIEVALRGKKLSELEARELLASNLEEISRLTVLSESLLALAKYQHGLSKKNLKELGIKQLTESVIKNNKHLINQNNIRIDSEVNDLKLYGDSSMITELVTIIMDNAIKYSPKNTVIHITTKKVGEDIQLIVSDQGIGISPDDLPHVFDRFYRADSSREETQGYGLGLSIAAEIVRLHKGKIDIKSTLGTGTEVIVTLPVKF